MSKKCLILVLSSDWPPYDVLMNCSQSTWDSINVKNCETVYYIAGSNPNTEKVIYVPVTNDLHSMGRKTLAAFEWALANKECNYLSRPQANVFIHKRELMNYIKTLPDENVFDTLEVLATPTTRRYGWGCGTLFSRDVVKKIVDNKHLWDHSQMEDVSMSHLLDDIGVPYRKGRIVSIDRQMNGWQATCYETESFQFRDLSEIVKAKGQYWFRTKQDDNRAMDCVIMNELFKYLK